MEPGQTVFSFILTLWRDPASGETGPRAWRGTVRRVAASSDAPAESTSRPFAGLGTLSETVERCLGENGGSRR